MPHENVSPLHTHEEAKAVLNKAESGWEKTSHALNRLRRERYQTKGEVTEAEREAERAYQKTLAVLTAAREHWRFIQSTIPKPKYRHGRKEKFYDAGLDEPEVE